MKGKIVKGIAGFYYVHVPSRGIFECKARGIFRNKKIKPLVGDDVTIELLENEEAKGSIIDILPRCNQLARPNVANIDQAIIVFAVNNPKPNFNLLDRFLVMTEREKIHAKICFNKIDILSENEVEAIKNNYLQSGYELFFTCAITKEGILELTKALYNNTTVFAGPSGVGKSSLLNKIQSKINLEIGELSEKIQRGKHTTRHAELIAFHTDSYVVDTPGFSSLSIEDINEERLKDYFIEFKQYSNQCKFYGCNHISEPNCAVKTALGNKMISQSRYTSYITLYNELKEIRRW